MFYTPLGPVSGPDDFIGASSPSGGGVGSGAGSQKADIDMLRADVERLLMITEALWGILKEKYGYEDTELIKRMVEIDMRDGSLDGRVAHSPPQPCPKCGRILAKHRPRCLYCGEPIAENPFSR